VNCYLALSSFQPRPLVYATSKPASLLAKDPRDGTRPLITVAYAAEQFFQLSQSVLRGDLESGVYGRFIPLQPKSVVGFG
jgi:hypothetical protein